MNAVYSGPKVTFPQYKPKVGGTSTADLAAADRASIAYLFDPTPDWNETDTLAAERAVSSGTVGSGFAANNQLRLRDSEKINRAQIGHGMLDPYLQREHAGSMQAADNAARLQQIAAQGEEARKQLELQNSGQMALQSAEARARLEQMALAGSQALEQLNISEAGDTSRLNTSIRGNLDLAGVNNAADLERTILGGAFSLYGRDGGSGGGSGGSGPRPYAQFSANTGNIGSSTKPFGVGTPQGFPGPSGPTPTSPGSYTPVINSAISVNTPQAQAGQSTGAAATRIVDQILSRYGLN